LSIKYYVINTIVSLGLFFSVLNVFGQATINSPYSFYGLGDRVSDGMVRSISMGDTKYAISNSFHLNPSNPASYSSLKTTSFNLAMHYQVNNLSSGNGSQRYDVAGMRYFGLGIPISKRIGAALGLTPVTQMGYDISALGSTQNEGVETSYNGKGGLSRVFLGLSYELVSNH